MPTYLHALLWLCVLGGALQVKNLGTYQAGGFLFRVDVPSPGFEVSYSGAVPSGWASMDCTALAYCVATYGSTPLAAGATAASLSFNIKPTARRDTVANFQVGNDFVDSQESALYALLDIVSQAAAAVLDRWLSVRQQARCRSRGAPIITKPRSF
jgi:hypothetical protein